MEIGNQIQKYRAEQGYSQDELAEKIFVTRQTVSNWENQHTYPDLHSLLLLGEVFGISLDQLVKGDLDEMKREINKERRHREAEKRRHGADDLYGAAVALTDSVGKVAGMGRFGDLRNHLFCRYVLCPKLRKAEEVLRCADLP